MYSIAIAITWNFNTKITITKKLVIECTRLRLLFTITPCLCTDTAFIYIHYSLCTRCIKGQPNTTYPFKGFSHVTTAVWSQIIIVCFMTLQNHIPFIPTISVVVLCLYYLETIAKRLGMLYALLRIIFNLLCLDYCGFCSQRYLDRKD